VAAARESTFFDASGDASGDVGSERVVALDILRGLMALCVALYHLAVWTRALGGGARSAVVVLGIYSVEGFFLISGFCFFHLYAGQRFDGPELRRFHIKRFFRIAPLYYLAMLLGVVFAFDQSVGPRVTLMRVVENVTLSFGLIHPNHSMVLGGWSIGLEYVFYLVFPALAFIARSRVLLYALALAALLWALPYNFGVMYDAPEHRKFHAYVQLPNHAFLFLLGALASDLRAHIKARIPAAATLALLAVIAYCASLTQPELLTHLEVMAGMARVKYLVLCTLVVLLFAFTKMPGARLIAPFAWIGEISYSVYLMHPFAWKLIEPVLAPQLSAQARLLCGLAATMMLSFVTWRLVERPCNALGHKLALRQAQSRLTELYPSRVVDARDGSHDISR
jgi:peptidoglycan/LPS O-acetylase OafA/YrhL